MFILSPLFEEVYYESELEMFSHDLVFNEEVYLEQEDYDTFMEYLSEALTPEQTAKVKLAGDNKMAKVRQEVGTKSSSYTPGFLRSNIDKFGATPVGRKINDTIESTTFLKRNVNRIKYGIADRVAKTSGQNLNHQINYIGKQQSDAVSGALNKTGFNSDFSGTQKRIDKQANNLAWAKQYRQAHEDPTHKAKRNNPDRIQKAKDDFAKVNPTSTNSQHLWQHIPPNSSSTTSTSSPKPNTSHNTTTDQDDNQETPTNKQQQNSSSASVAENLKKSMRNLSKQQKQSYRQYVGKNNGFAP